MRIYALLACILGIVWLNGCGGGNNSLTTRQTTPVSFQISWAGRSRAVDAPASALSMVLTLKGANPGGGDFTFVVDRLDAPSAYKQTYTSSSPARVGNWNASLNFYAGKGGQGAIVGIASKPITLKSDGTGIGDIATTGTIATVTMPSGQTLHLGQTSDLTFSALDSKGASVAVTPGSVVFAVVIGADKLQIVNGQAKGLASGTATVSATVDGITSPSVAVAVLQSKIVFYREGVGTGDIWIMNSDGSNPIMLTQGDGRSVHPALSADGSTIAFIKDNDLWTMNANGSNPRKIVSGAGSSSLSWSPDGTRLAFGSNDASGRYISVCNIDGSNLRNLTGPTLTRSFDPAWSPDGKTIVFGTTVLNNLVLWIMNADGSNMHQLIDDGDSPTWSPDGTKIAYYGGVGTVWVMNADGSNRHSLPGSLRGDHVPSWSPDGTQITFETNDGDNIADIWAMNSDGSNRRQLTTTGDNFSPQWGFAR